MAQGRTPRFEAEESVSADSVVADVGVAEKRRCTRTPKTSGASEVQVRGIRNAVVALPLPTAEPGEPNVTAFAAACRILPPSSRRGDAPRPNQCAVATFSRLRSIQRLLTPQGWLRARPMKKFFSLFVIAGLLLIGGVAFFLNSQAELNKKEMERELAQAKQKFSESHASMRSTPDAKTYAHDAVEIFKKYRSDLEKVAKRDKSLLDLDAEKKKWAEQDEKKPVSADHKKLRDEYFELVKATFERLEKGDYQPELTAYDAGARFDILSMKRVTNSEGEEVLRADFVAWGFPPEVSWGDIAMHGWVPKKEDKPKTAKAKAAAEEDADAGRELKYKFEAPSARPTLAISNPERWVKGFPPGATLGYYYLQLLPRDTEVLDLQMKFSMTTDTGRNVPVTANFTRLPVKDAWMLAPGAKFEAQEKELSEEERKGLSKIGR